MLLYVACIFFKIIFVISAINTCYVILHLSNFMQEIIRNLPLSQQLQ